MKLKDGRITFLINQDETTIRIIDNTSGTIFCSVTLSPKQLSSALSRLGMTPCSIEVRGLDRVGKKHEHREFAFEIPEELFYREHVKDNASKLHEIGQKLLDEEGGDWILDSYFLPQSTFSKNKTTGKFYAREIARRYVPIIENE